MKIFENGIENLVDLVKETTSFMFDDAEEIGSSDISCCVASVLGHFYEKPREEASSMEWQMIRNAVYREIRCE